MAIFKLRNNKKYGYTPRYYQHDGEGSPFQIEPRYDKFRKSTGSTAKGLKGKFNMAMDDLKTADSRVNKRILIIALILLFLFFALIGFDFSIFIPKK